VEGVLIGGVAIQNYRPLYHTDDLDFAPAVDSENLRRLAAALNELECRLIVNPSDASSQVALRRDYFTPASSATRAPGTSPPDSATSTSASSPPASPAAMTTCARTRAYRP
jgi:hypothetical protein